jgi:hypothetical protein
VASGPCPCGLLTAGWRRSCSAQTSPRLPASRACVSPGLPVLELTPPQIATRGLPGDIAIQSRAAGATVGCGAFFGGTALVQVLPNALRVLERDGAERQLIKDVDGPAARARIRAAAVCDPYAAVLRADGTLGLFVAADARKLRRKDMSALGDKSARYDAVTFFADRTGVFGVKDAVWIVLVRPQSVLEACRPVRRA